MTGKEDFQKQILKSFATGGIVPVSEEKIQAVTGNVPKDTKFDKKIPPRYRALRPPKHKIDTLAIFWGNVGSGKTCEAISNMREQYVAGKINSWHWDTEMGVITMLKAGFNDGTFNKEYQRMKTIDFLIVDEMGKCNDSEFNNCLLYTSPSPRDQRPNLVSRLMLEN